MEKNEARRYIALLKSGNEKVEHFLYHLKAHYTHFAETALWHNISVHNGRHQSRVKDVVFTGDCEIVEHAITDGMVDLRMTFSSIPPHFSLDQHLDCIPETYAETPGKKREMLEMMARFLSVDVRVHKGMVEE